MRVDIKVPFKCVPLKFVQNVKITYDLMYSTSATPEDITRKILREKFSDMRFDNIDFNNLEQDDFSLMTNNIVGLLGRKYDSLNKPRKMYGYFCKKCSQQPELYGCGVFITPKTSLDKGIIPCGCSKKPNYTQYQYNIKLYDKAKSINYILVNVMETNSQYSKCNIELYCKIHKAAWTTTRVTNFLNNGENGCKECKIENHKQLRIFGLDRNIEIAFNTGNYHKNTIFKYKNENKKTEDDTVIVICPICYNDEYVKNNLCSGIFESTFKRLKKGSMPCRCNPKHAYTIEQREYQIINEMLKRGDSTFLGWVDTYENISSNMIMKCDTCDELYHPTFENWYSFKTGCPNCNNGAKGSKNLFDIDQIVDFDEKEKKFNDCVNIRSLPFDRYCNFMNMLLEYDGRQHFESVDFYGGDTTFKQRIENDRIKTEYAINNGYNFIRIAHYEDHVKALESFLALVLKHQDKQIVQIYGEVQILDKP